MNRITKFTSSPLFSLMGFNENYPIKFCSDIIGGSCLLQKISIYVYDGPIGVDEFELALCDYLGHIIKRVPLVEDGIGYGSSNYYVKWTADFEDSELTPGTFYKLIPYDTSGNPINLMVQQGTGSHKDSSIPHGSVEILETLYPVACEMTARRIAAQLCSYVPDFQSITTPAQSKPNENEDLGSILFNVDAILLGARRVSLSRVAIAFEGELPSNAYLSCGGERASLVKGEIIPEIGVALYEATFNAPVLISGDTDIMIYNVWPARFQTTGEGAEEGMPMLIYGPGTEEVRARPAAVIDYDVVYAEEDPVYQRSKETFSTFGGSVELKTSRSDGRISFLGSLFKGRSPKLREVLFKHWQDGLFPTGYNHVSVYVDNVKIATSPIVDYGDIKSVVFNTDIAIENKKVYLALESFEGIAPMSPVKVDLLTSPEGYLPVMAFTSEYPSIAICADSVLAGGSGTTVLDLKDLSAIGATDVVQEERSFSPSTVEFCLPVSSPDSPCPLFDRERVRIVDGDHILIEGTISSIDLSLEGNSKRDRITISDDWYLLEQTPYISYGTIRGRVGVGGNSGSSTSTDAQCVPISAAFNQVLSYAGIDYELRISNGVEMIPFTANASKVGDLLQKIRQWRPGLTAFWDYSNGRKLVISDQIQLENRVFDISARENSFCDIKARPDLSPPVVAIYCEDRRRDGGTFYSVTKYPENESVSQPFAYTVAGPSAESSYVDENGEEPENGTPPSWEMNLDKIVIKGTTIKNDDEGIRDFVFRKMPVLKKYEEIIKPVAGSGSVNGLDYDGVESEKPQNYDKQAINMELIEGSLTNKCGIKWCNSEVKVTLLLQKGVSVPDEIKGYFPGVDSHGNRKGVFSYKVTTINRGGTYIIGGGVDNYPGDEPPEPPETTSDGNIVSSLNVNYMSLVKDYYDVTRIPQYEGSLNTVDKGYEIVIGSTMSLIGGREEHQNMRALIQSIRRDLKYGKTTVSVGPHSYLSLENALSRASLNDQIEESEQNEEDKPEPYSPEATNWEWDNRREFPNVSPSCIGGVTGISEGGSDCPFMVKLAKDDSGIWSAHVKHGFFASESGKNVGLTHLEEEITIPDTECYICIDWEYSIMTGITSAKIESFDSTDGAIVVITPITGAQSIGGSRVALAKIGELKEDGTRDSWQLVTTNLQAHWIPNYKQEGSDTIAAAQNATAGRGCAV